VNTFTVQSSYYDTTQLMPTTLPTSQWPLQNVTFPSIELGRTGPSTDQEFFEHRWEFKDDFAHQAGKHSLKFGGGYDFFPSIVWAFCSAVPWAEPSFRQSHHDCEQRGEVASQPRWLYHRHSPSSDPTACGNIRRDS